MDAHAFRVDFDATASAFGAAFLQLRSQLDRLRLDPVTRYRVELVFEEIAGNIVRYAAPPGSVAAVSVAVEMQPDAVEVTFEDDGVPFDPCARPDPARPATLAEAPVGGLGLKMVRRAAASMAYERTSAQRNRLVVTIHAVPGCEAA